MNLHKLIRAFHSKFGLIEIIPRIFFAPGRINLIGEHTDYNGGKVFPAAIDVGTYMLIRKNNSGIINFRSENFEFKISVPLDAEIKKIGNEWINYPLGVINEFLLKGKNIGGFDIMYSGNIPNGAGLSSSASIEMATAYGLNQLFETGFGTLDLVWLCKHAENHFVGVNCGIMDMFAVGFGKANHAIALDCSTLDFDYAPLNLQDFRLIVSNTNKERGLADSKYNERVAECQEAVRLIQKRKGIINLSNLSIKDFYETESSIKNPVLKRRAYHVVSENNRVGESLLALKNDDLQLFGQFMIASHNSLRDNYEVTGPELDALVNVALKVDGVIGSRMTGAGFGGCTISLVKENRLELFYSQVANEYESITGLVPEFYLVEPSDGVRELQFD